VLIVTYAPSLSAARAPRHDAGPRQSAMSCAIDIGREFLLHVRDDGIDSTARELNAIVPSPPITAAVAQQVDAS